MSTFFATHIPITRTELIKAIDVGQEVNLDGKLPEDVKSQRSVFRRLEQKIDIVDLNLSNNNFTKLGLKELNEVIVSNPNLTILNLKKCNLVSPYIQTLASTIAGSNIKVLNLAGNGLTPKDIQWLLDELKKHNNTDLEINLGRGVVIKVNPEEVDHSSIKNNIRS